MAEPDNATSDLLMAPLARLLRPLVRLLIARGITYPVICDLLRGLFVEVAQGDLPLRARTDSRLSVLTGVHRKEIRRLRELRPDADTTPAVITLTSQAIARWLSDDAYRDKDGSPLPLPRRASTGPSFERLVTSITTDVRARTLLDDWLRQGLVTIDTAGQVRLETSAFLPRPGSAAQLFYFARNLHDHIAAAAANIGASGAAPYFDRSLHYDRLSVDAAAKLETLGRATAQRVLVDLNRKAMRLAGDEAEVGPTRRVNVGIYVYAEDDTDGDRKGE